MAQSQRYVQYIDPETGVVRRPEGWDEPFGDGVWRSSWFHASLILIKALDDTAYRRLVSDHDVDVSSAGRFLTYFRDNCLGDNGWQLPKSDQEFSMDQLVPLLYLLCTVPYHAEELKDIGRDILKSLGRLEEHHRGVSSAPKGAIGRGIGYMIDVLSDDARYDMNYRSWDLPAYLVPCLGNIKCAKGNRRGAYKEVFSLSLTAQALPGWTNIPGVEDIDEYSVFNALASVSLQCIAWGKGDNDVQDWRSNFGPHADGGWGPAFRLVTGRPVSNEEIEDYYTAHVTRAQDNDIIMAQRPSKIRDGVLTPNLKGGPEQWLVLDYVILKALQLLWA